MTDNLPGSISRELDDIDMKLCALLQRRMELCESAAEGEKADGAAAPSLGRERKALSRVRKLGEKCGSEVAEMYSQIVTKGIERANRVFGIENGGEQIIDISKELLSTPPYPGDPYPTARKIMMISAGEVCNLTELKCSLHNATHADAPLHFIDRGEDIASLPPERFVGDCVVIEREGDIAPSDISKLPQGTERLLIKGELDVSEKAAQAIVKKGIKLVGVERQSVGGVETHRILLGSGLVLLEGLDLSRTDEGEYYLMAQPIKIAGAEGSLCRALLSPKRF